jgi:hypothetical protein
MSSILHFVSRDKGSVPKLAAQVSAANVEVIDVAESLARQAAATQDDELRRTLMEAASRLVRVNRTVNDAVETAIGAAKG